MKKKKNKAYDVGKTVRHISREIFFGKLPSQKVARDKKKFHKGSRTKNRRVESSRDYSPFIMFQVKHIFLIVLERYVAHETFLTTIPYFNKLFQVKPYPPFFLDPVLL